MKNRQITITKRKLKPLQIQNRLQKLQTKGTQLDSAKNRLGERRNQQYNKHMQYIADDIR